jgi:hypothetical protein
MIIVSYFTDKQTIVILPSKTSLPNLAFVVKSHQSSLHIAQSTYLC